MNLRMKARQIARRSSPKMVRRWATERCDSCGHRRRYVESWHTYGNRDGKVWHGPCMAFEQWRTTADERLAVLDLICDVWGVTQSDVEQVVALRTSDDAPGGNERNRAWRVMYSLQNHRVAARSAGEQP
jgi:hypothetical protein